MAFQIDLYIKHIVDIHSGIEEAGIEDQVDNDSGRWSWDVELPGADLSHLDFTQEFATQQASQVTDHNSHYAISLEDLNESPITPRLLQKQRRKLQRRGRRIQLELPSDFNDPSVLLSEPKQELQELDDKKDCIICTSQISYQNNLVILDCCGESVCAECMEILIRLNVNDGHIYMPCPNSNCTKAFKRDLIIKYITSDEIRNKYERFRLNHEGDGKKKACPNCCLITELDVPPFNPKRKTDLTPQEYKVSCNECSFQWCFNCHSPWHEGLSCNSYREGDKQFTKWTKTRNVGYTPNCQKCPKCKVYIERSAGCDSMTCNRCHTNFCYKCGEKFSGFPGLGDHYKHLSIFGCPYNYNPNKPIRRKLIRGGYLFVKCAALTAFPVVLVGGVALLAVGVVVLVPVVVGGSAAVLGGRAAYRAIRRR